MNFCPKCGNKLYLKELNNEGLIPYCNNCQKYHFETFSCAVIMIVINKDRTKTLLIQQYGKKRNILVAGYINKGESAESACVRELKEEVGLTASKLIFQKSEFHEKSNCLMLNYVVYVDDDNITSNEEIDLYKWYDLKTAKTAIADGSLAQKFYLSFYEEMKNEI